LIQDASPADLGKSSSNVTSNPSKVIEKKQVDILTKNSISIMRICFMNFVDLYRARIATVGKCQNRSIAGTFYQKKNLEQLKWPKNMARVIGAGTFYQKKI
jgi:hypothetical protein